MFRLFTFNLCNIYAKLLSLRFCMLLSNFSINFVLLNELFTNHIVILLVETFLVAYPPPLSGGLSNTIRHDAIFCLNIGSGDGVLTLGGTRDEIITKEHSIARGGLAAAAVKEEIGGLPTIGIGWQKSWGRRSTTVSRRSCAAEGESEGEPRLLIL